MSLFLGKIHFWLFDKIRWFENLEGETLEIAKKHDMPVDNWVEYASERFGEKTPNKPLDALIDEGNIHGWLEARINAAEGRGAYYITSMLKENKNVKSELIELYKDNGISNADECKELEKEMNAQDIYTALNNYILDGMPCDRVNKLLENSSEKVSWEMTTDLHKRFWDDVQGDVSVFHELRDAWTETFIRELNPNFTFEVYENGKKAILKG